jgi:4-hydroxybenzoate polyprenyltransferase
MSFFKLGMDKIQEALVLGLMLVFIFAIVYSGIGWMYKIGIGALVVTLVFVATMANQALRQQREEEKKRLN